MEDVKGYYEPSLPAHDIELARGYSPTVVFWQLTPLGTKRLADREVSTSLPLNAYRVLDLINKLDYAEEDELSNTLDISLSAVRETVARLAGFGYVQQAQLKEK